MSTLRALSARISESTALGLMIAGLCMSLSSWPLYVAHAAGAV